MKKSALFILFALISVAGFSQITGWNAKVGMNISNYTGDADLNAKIGFKLGGGFEYAHYSHHCFCRLKEQKRMVIA